VIAHGAEFAFPTRQLQFDKEDRDRFLAGSERIE
jgi:hypothetical protein